IAVASGIPCTFPEGDDSGVLISPCASSQIKPIFFSFFLKCAATPYSVPAALEWSPPRTTGSMFSSNDFSTIAARSLQATAISARYLARFSPYDISAGCFTEIFPMSSTWCPSCLMRACNPATRSADGPISTPRRLAPRSMGTPMIRIFCAISLFLDCDGYRPISADRLSRVTSHESLVTALRIYPVQHARERNHFANVLCPANPRHGAFQPHAKSRMRHAAVAPQIQIPPERFLRQVVLAKPFHQQIVVMNALAPADDLSVAFRRQHVERQRQIRALRIRLHVKRFDRCRIAVYQHRPVKLI